VHFLLKQLAGIYSIHRLSPAAAKRNVTMIADALLEQKTLFAVLKSADELSLVCDAHLAVTADRTSGPWRAMRVLGELDFALTGILAGLTTPLAEAGIPVFAISSYDTDYLLVAAENAEHARTTLIAAGFEVEQRPTDSNTNA
jgi:hypothetical protein